MQNFKYLFTFSLLPCDNTGNTVIGGSTFDNDVSLLMNQKPLIVYVKKGGEFKWSFIINILSYISISAISFKDGSTSTIAFSLESLVSSTDPLNVMLISSSGITAYIFTSTSGIKGYIPSSGLKFESSGNFYLAMHPESTNQFSILKFGSTASNKNTVFYWKWNQMPSYANVVANDDYASIYYFGGILIDNGGNVCTAIVIALFDGSIQQILAISSLLGGWF
ncbi:UNKNOWN [Stylonychia lemnae]|uniref:Uncharacterized protein n=1 Tax=Stylonychia lemnae TaxID=5949 RepID=A0A078A769_STYLE|nr:UNKNOWN [Stylonychia lemnae]|eukprot:CDW76641.1 UNKNOWN [Stylonychia lemnae]